MTSRTAIIQLGANGSPFSVEESSSSMVVVQVRSKDDLASSLSSVPQSSLTSINIQVKSNDLVDYLNPLAMASLMPPLQTNGTLKVSVFPSSDGTAPDTTIISTAFLLSGLTAESEGRDADGMRAFTAVKKAQSSSGAKAKRINLSSTSNEEKKQDLPSTRVTLDNLDDEDDNMVDEDALLEDDNGGLLAPPDMSASARKKSTDDCGARKACDDCTCGRAEQEAGTAEPVEKKVASSSCGNCSKGDAFRCGGCPYLGKPAFKAGTEHLVLDLTDDI
jgi:hypothetical protein